MGTDRPHVLAALLFTGFTTLLFGCGETQTLQVDYTVPPKVVLPGHVKTIAVTRLVGDSFEEKTWGVYVADRISERLDLPGRQVLSRRQVDRALRDSSISPFVTTTSQALEVAQRVDADAIIYGSLSLEVPGEERPASINSADTAKPGTRMVVNIIVLDVENTARLAEANLVQTYQPERDAAVSGRDRVPMELAESCADAMVFGLTGMEVDQVVTLRKGLTEAVEQGNELALARKYRQALRMYVVAMSQRGDDDVAYYQAGLMHELLGNPDKAAILYTRALNVTNRPEYRRALQRVRPQS
ncbi:MAG: hypothetical protein ACLFVU_09025 [Phycisphaerae bacterium]